jgi:putative membrane protein
MNLKACLIATAILLPGVASANDTPKTTTTAPTTTKSPDGPKSTASTKLTDDETKIVSHIKHVNDMEISMGKLAQQKGSADVKKYGAMLVKDHTANNTKLTALAKKKGITKIPAEVAVTETEKMDDKMMTDDMAKLKTLKGAEFDKQLLTMAVAGHDKTLAELTSASAAAKDSDLIAHIDATKPVVQTHADKARELQKKPATTSMR